jgi:hypothetical protein
MSGVNPGNRSRAAQIVTWTIFGVNLALLLYSITDYRMSIDSGYHISLARWYAEHGTAWWDHINFGPGGRPNLQGPALHVAIAILGRMLGGTADAYILADAILAVVQWSAAILTAWYFARRLGGDLAALFAVALLAGSAYASGSFYVGIPSGWLFITIPWAIHFFLADQLIAATLLTSLACYTHLGGFLTVPAGIAIAAILERRWRALAIVGGATTILTAPYWIHFLANLAWYRGQHGHEALHLDPLIDILAIAGAVWFFRRPSEHHFLVAWAAAPIAWLIQDPNRFAAQSTLAGSVIGGLFLADMMARMAAPRIRIAFATFMVAFATIFPLGIPNLLAEAAWDAGLHFPRALDWDEARGLADVLASNRVGGCKLSVYETSFGPSIAVFTPVVLYRGHWVEVQPRHDPADDMSAATWIYVVPLAPDDPVLKQMDEMGLMHTYGGTAESAVVGLTHPGDPNVLAPLASKILADNARWLAANAINNKMPPPNRLIKLLTPAALEAHRRTMDEQRFHAGRMEIACVVYAYSLEATQPQNAHLVRNVARGFGSLASFLSDGDPVGYASDAQHAEMQRNMTALANALDAASDNPLGSAAVHRALRNLFYDYFGE